MSESVKLLRGIIKTSGWTQEQVAMKLGVSFPTMNAWVNGKSKPRAAMMDKIRKLYLAQDVTKDIEPTYVTLINVPRWLKIDDIVILKKDVDNNYDDEAVMAELLDSGDNEWVVDECGDKDNGREDDAGGDDEFGGDVAPIEVNEIRITSCPEMDLMYVANSTSTVVRGTSSAGRIYDKFGVSARARVLFIHHKTAIARVVEWDYAEKGE